LLTAAAGADSGVGTAALRLSGEIVASEHWCSSGFANTDLDLQLKRHGIQRLIVIGLIAHTCIEATVRFAAELGYDVTVVKDAVADYSNEMMHAALEINLPSYASAIVTTKSGSPTPMIDRAVKCGVTQIGWASPTRRASRCRSPWTSATRTPTSSAAITA